MDDDYCILPEGAMVYMPEIEVLEGLVVATSYRNTYGIIRTDANERYSFVLKSCNDSIESGDWVIFNDSGNEFRNIAVNVRKLDGVDDFNRISL